MRSPAYTLTIAAMAAAIAAIPGMAAAQAGASGNPQGKATILGAGARACADWVKDRSEDGPDGHAEQAWVEGFLSAMSTVLPTPDTLMGVQRPAVLLWIDSYCTENQDDSIGRAATALFLELRARASIADSLPPERPPPDQPPRERPPQQ